MSKESLSIPDQISKLQSNGLLDTRQQLSKGLLKYGYFRLSGYWRFFQVDPANGNNVFLTGTDYSTVEDLYLADTELRNLLLEGLAEVEIALRSAMTAFMCKPGDPGIEYLDPASYDDRLNSDGAPHREVLLQEIKKDIERSKERHVMHHRRQGTHQVPFWVANEALSFGILSRIYGLWENESERLRIAKRFGYDEGLAGYLPTNLRSISALRNLCAHHGRLWNRVVTAEKPKLFSGIFPNEPDYRRKYGDTSWGLIKILCHLVKSIRQDDSFEQAVGVMIYQDHDFSAGLTLPDRTR